MSPAVNTSHPPPGPASTKPWPREGHDHGTLAHPPRGSDFWLPGAIAALLVVTVGALAGRALRGAEAAADTSGEPAAPSDPR
jgi:hypothetical protein